MEQANTISERECALNELETELNRLLGTWQTSIANHEKRDAKEEAKAGFYSYLISLPKNYKSMSFKVAIDSQQSNRDTLIENFRELLKTESLDQKRLEYMMMIAIPREPDYSDLTQNHGSAIRERLVNQGKINTFQFDYDEDPKTGDKAIVRINPLMVGPFELDRSLGTYSLFPRQFKEIKLHENLPPYFSERQILLVNNFYQGSILSNPE